MPVTGARLETGAGRVHKRVKKNIFIERKDKRDVVVWGAMALFHQMLDEAGLNYAKCLSRALPDEFKRYFLWMLRFHGGFVFEGGETTHRPWAGKGFIIYDRLNSRMVAHRISSMGLCVIGPSAFNVGYSQVFFC